MRYAGRNHHEVLHLFSFVYSLGRRRGIIRTGSYPTLSPGRMLRFCSRWSRRHTHNTGDSADAGD